MSEHRFVFDTEGNGLLDTVTRVWCAVFKDIENGAISVVLEDRDNFVKMVESIPPGSFVIGHNILGYDLPALKKVWDIDYTVGFLTDTWMGKEVFFVDTLHLSQFLNVERDGHGLEDWGNRLKFLKGEHTDFTQFSSEMVDYCVQDVELTQRVYEYLINESKEKYK